MKALEMLSVGVLDVPWMLRAKAVANKNVRFITGVLVINKKVECIPIIFMFHPLGSVIVLLFKNGITDVGVANECCLHRFPSDSNRNRYFDLGAGKLNWGTTKCVKFTISLG
jgi:hypothetical protein